MDVAYNQHSREAKRKNRSTTNLNHLTLAPLTTKLPLDHHHHSSDHEQHVTIADSTTWTTASFVHSTSYLQGKSAPTTPGLLSRSPARSRSRGHNGSSSSRRGGASTPTSGGGGGGSHLPKSKSATHLPAAAHSRHLASHSVTTLSTTTHGGTAGVRRRRGEDGFLSATREREDSDWLLRAGAVISSETRESKGQAWLLSRASSTSLSGMRDAEEEALEREMARERELASRSASRRGSLAPGEDNAFYSSPPGSRFGSRSQSRAGSRTQMLTPGERRSVDGYFAEVGGSSGSHERFPEPDFVSLDEALESVEQDTTVEDEADVRRLVKREKAGVGAWLGNMVGWPLFSVQENEEESSEDDEDDEELYTEGSLDEVMLQGRRRSGVRQFEGVADLSEERVPPPKENEGGWQDAAWLLTVASKVLL